MKILCLLFFAGSCGLLWAQTNPPAPESTAQDIGVNSDHFYFDGKARELVYYGNVVATNAQGQLTCGRLTIQLPPEGSSSSHPTNAVAETNVVIDFVKNGLKHRDTADKVIYAYGVADSVTNETLTFTGHAMESNAQYTATGEPLVWDNVAGKFTGTDFKMVSHPAPNSGASQFGLNLNGAAARTNAPLPTNSLGMDTNFPPGKLDLFPPIHRVTPPPSPPPDQ